MIPGRLSGRVWLHHFGTAESIIPFVSLFISFSLVYLYEHIWTVFLGVGLGGLISRFLKLLTGRSVVTLEPRRLTIEWRSAGVTRKVESFAPDQINRLRFVHSTQGADIRNDLCQSEIQFDDDRGTTHSFAFGVTPDEAGALIEKLMQSLPAHEVKQS